ncbi:MAG: hypothetical protein LBU32_09200 [Clostridiales bacterium]|nr:hypothetical protein [Clostridiales bacterium]
MFHGEINESLDACHFDEALFAGAGIVYFGSVLTFPLMDRGGIEKILGLST